MKLPQAIVCWTRCLNAVGDLPTYSRPPSYLVPVSLSGGQRTSYEAAHDIN